MKPFGVSIILAKILGQGNDHNNKQAGLCFIPTSQNEVMLNLAWLMLLKNKRIRKQTSQGPKASFQIKDQTNWL